MTSVLKSATFHCLVYCRLYLGNNFWAVTLPAGSNVDNPYVLYTQHQNERLHILSSLQRRLPPIFWYQHIQHISFSFQFKTVVFIWILFLTALTLSLIFSLMSPSIKCSLQSSGAAQQRRAVVSFVNWFFLLWVGSPYVLKCLFL